MPLAPRHSLALSKLAVRTSTCEDWNCTEAVYDAPYPRRIHFWITHRVAREYYIGTLLIRKRTTLGPYRRPMPRVLGGFQGGVGIFLWARFPCTYVHL